MARFVDLSRYSALLVVLLALGALLGAGDLLTRGLLGLAPRELSRTEYLNPDYLGELGGRVSAVEQQLAKTQPRSPELGVVLGLSTTREALVETELTRAQPQLRWLNLAGSGGSFYELSYYASPLGWSQLRPKTVVLGVHPFYMAGRIIAPRPLDASPAGLLGALRRHDLGGVSERVKRWSWLVFNRNRLTLNLERGLAFARQRLFRSLGLPLSALFPPSKEPWRVKREYDGHAPAQELARQMQMWTGFRWFESSRYTEDTVEAEAFQELLRECRDVSPRVIVVLMPEASALRARMPQVAKPTLLRALRAFDPTIELLDLSDALPDDAFFDNSHVGTTGRKLVTERLIEYLTRGPPP